MFSQINDFANKEVNIGENVYPLWQVASVSTAALVLGYKTYKRLTRPKYGFHTTASDIMNGQDLSDRIIIVTGANTGLGKETVRYLLEAGATVVMACRSEKRGNAAKADILGSLPQNKSYNVSLMILDLGDFDSIFGFANAFKDQFDRLDILVNNAGVSVTDWKTTKQGYEIQFGVNHMGHSYLTLLLTPLLKKSKYNGRVVVLSSGSHRKTNLNEDFGNILKSGKGPVKEKFEEKGGLYYYGVAKSANMLFAYEYHKRHFEQYNIGCVSLHPGLVGTDLVRNFSGPLYYVMRTVQALMAKSIQQGIATTLRCCTLTKEEMESYGGEYFDDCQPWSINKHLPKPWNAAAGVFLKDDHDPLINENFAKISKEFYDWTLQKLKETGAKLEI